MAKKVQLMTNTKEWQTVNGVEVLIDVPNEDIDPITDSNCVEIEGHRTLEETISQDNMFTPEIVETKVHSKVGGVYHDNVVDGAYEEAILYGNTQVNLVESVTTGTKYIPHSFTSFQGNESKIGNYHNGRTNQVAPLVKGVTMVNLAQTTSSSAKVGSGVWVSNIKPSTKYTLSLTYTIQNSRKGLIIQSYNDTTYLENSKQITGLETNVQLTFITHENANAVRICNAEGYGGETIQLDNIMVIEGDVTDLNLPFFKGMRSVELSRPLTNLFTDDLDYRVTTNVVVTNSGGTITTTAQSITTWSCSAFYLNVKPNTEYLVMWDSLSYTHTDTTTQSTICVYGDSKNIAVINNTIKCSTLRSLTFNSAEYKTIELRFHATASNSETGVTTVTGLRVFEWDDSLRTLDLQTIGYFSGTKYVSVRALETEGKNLYPHGDINFTPTDDKVGNWYDAKGTMHMYGDVAQKSKSRFLLKKGTYTIRFGTWSNIDAFQLINDKEVLHGKIQSMATPTTFTLKQDTYCTLRLKATSKNVATTVTGIQIERGETATTYEAYQSRYYKPRETEEIILRSLPNGVCDTFNLQTGELVQRVGEVVLDGDENIKIVSSVSNDTHTYFDFDSVFVGALNDGDLICDSFTHIDGLYGSEQTVEGINIGKSYWGSIRILNSRLSSVDVDGFKTWLQENPVTVQYELKEPIITKLQTYDRVYNGQTNALVIMGNNLSALTYYSSNYYVKVGNLSPVPAILEPITTIPYDVRLKPSTLYTVKYNRGGNSNSMKFDLGGSVVEKTNSITSTTGIAEELTVRTPAILSHEQLILSGTGYAHKFIVVEGDITGTELPYFEGMKDVKMPIVKNIGKNLFDINGAFELGYLGEGNGLVTLSDRSTNFIRGNGGFSLTITKSYGGVVTPYIKVKPNTKYVASAEYINVSASQNNFVFYDRNKKMIDNTSLREVVLHKTFTTPSSCEYIRIGFWLFNPGIIYYENIQLEECLDSSLSTPYQQHKENSVYAVQGEIPLSEDMFEQGTVLWTNKGIGVPLRPIVTNGNCLQSNNNSRIRLKDTIRSKPNAQYIISINDDYEHLILPLDINKAKTDYADNIWKTRGTHIITMTGDTEYITYVIRKHDDTPITPSEFSKTNTLLSELDSTINLRSLPNGVKDELNLLTGEYIQRVGEVVVDGSGHFTMKTNNNGQNYAVFYFEGLNKATEHGISNYLPAIQLYDATVLTTDGFCANISNLNEIRLFINGLTSVEDYIGYFSNKPLTIQYELAEPIISHVRLVSNNQEREVGVKLPRGQVNTYNPSIGITTIRVGKMVLDGSENWALDTTKTNTQVFRLVMYDIAMTQNNLYCETMRVASGIDAEIIATAASNLYIGLLKTKASTVDELKTYLASNPITVWYELKYPQIQPDIVLPNGVHDEYNPETGVYTKKVGFAEFDGSADEGWRAAQTDPNRFVCETLTDRKYYSSDVIKDCMLCDKITVVSYKELYGTDGTDGVYGIAPFGSSANIQMRLESITTAEQLQQYLSQNPIKLWYELATPITYQLTPYFGLPQPYAYEDGYLVHESAYPETTLPPEFKYKLVANRTGQIVQNGRKLQEHTTRLSNLEALIIEATIQSLFDRELQTFELELMDIQLIDLGE